MIFLHNIRCKFSKVRYPFMRRKYPFSIAEIAALAEVSCATVSRVLNNQDAVKPELYDKVCDALRTRGVNPDDVILQVENAGKLILFTLPFDFNSFFNEIIKGAKASAAQHGYQMLILQEHINVNTFPAFEKLLKNMKISGLITLNHINSGLMEKLTDLLPVVQCCDYDLKSQAVSSVTLDDQKTAKSAVDYLITQGRHHIAFMSGPLRYSDNFYRKEGYLQSLRLNRIEPSPNWIIHLPEINYNMAFSSATQLLSQPTRPDAFIAISDLFACAIINAAHRLNLSIPEDLMVVGYDNVDYSLISTPTITTINTPKFQLGYTACEILIEQILNPNASIQHLSLPSELIIRESTSVK